jgi:hypothetical protein
MDWIDILGKLAPTVATCLGSPVAGMAITALESALGMKSEDIKTSIQDNKLTAEQVAAIQTAEIELKKQAQQLGLNFEKLAVDDRISARNMQAATKSWIPGVLAIGVTIGFFGILIGLMTDNVTKSDALLLMLGSLGTAWTAIVSFYFGSSAASQEKDQLLHQSTPVNKS